MKKVLISLLMLAAAVTTQAQAISEEYAAEVSKTLKLQHTSETMLEGMRMGMQQLIDNGTMTQESVDAYCKELNEILTPVVLKRMVELYHENFTLAELKQMNTFLASPVGQKNVRLTPIFAAEGMKITSSPEIQQQIYTILSKYINK